MVSARQVIMGSGQQVVMVSEVHQIIIIWDLGIPHWLQQTMQVIVSGQQEIMASVVRRVEQ